jgi:Flp pilus assembly protein TadD
LRALSWLAESTGNPEQAMSYAQAALENDPEDAWTLYQCGRLAAQRDDQASAMQYFQRALELELDFTDVLFSVAELQHRAADYASAERYLERALSLEPKNPTLLALRGQNQVQLGLLRDAEDSFRAALSIAADDPVSRAGLAWCYYRKNQPDEAITRLRELDDNRRSQPETDPYRRHALAEIARIQDHVQKVAWTDRFERTNLMNGWEVEERNGPQVTIHDGLVTLAGSFKNNGRARLWREIGAASFVAVEMKITVKSETTARVGLFLSRESVRSGEAQVEAEAVIIRHNEPGRNTAQTRLMKRGEEDLPYNDVAGLEWKLNEPVTVRIERIGDATDTRIRVLLDGFPVVDGKSMPTLAKTNQPLRLGLFAEGASGKKVSVDVDDVEVVFRQSN